MHAHDRPELVRRMSPKHILVILLAYAVALSGFLTYLDLRGTAEPAWLALATSLVFSALIFAWYLADTQQRGYTRTALLNIAIILVSVVAVPYYLLRSRARGQRLKAITRMLGVFVLLLLAMLAGGLVVSLVAGEV